ncbi:Rec8 like protein-domain-containing protein [Pyronema omphalodes]|nr:Rec8 like protein-domain-containing protein [Pyronema omphalodes]
MFYSHEVLTERQYGIATIWLVATLGLSRTTLKKLGRRDILAVNLPKACGTVIEPIAPLALRLQSNLLIGISRVYKQQTEYLYHDVTNAHTNIKKLEISNNLPNIAANLDHERGGEGRPEQLILTDDPRLHPDLLLDIDLAGLGELSLGDVDLGDFNDLANSLQTGQMTPSLRSQITQQSQLFSPGAMVPGSSSSIRSGAAGTGFEPSQHLGHDSSETGVDYERLELEENPLFEFDENGEMREVTPTLPDPFGGDPTTPRGDGDRTPRARVPGTHGSEDIEERVRKEHDEAGRPGSEAFEMDQHPGSDLFPEFHQQMNLSEHPPSAQPIPADETMGQSSLAPGSEHLPSEASSEQIVAEAAAKKTRGPRAKKVIIDDDIELTNHDLKEQHKNYLQNMEAARKAMEARKLNREAKINAGILVLQHGISGLLLDPTLKETFSGQAIINSILGIIPSTTGGESPKKRKIGEIGSDNEENGRASSRARTVEPATQPPSEIGRGGDAADNFSMGFGSELGMGGNLGQVGTPGYGEMEVGRDAPPGLPSDFGSVKSYRSDGMPWSNMGLPNSPLPGPVGGAPSSSIGYGGIPSSPMARNTRAMSRMSVAGSVRSMLDIVPEVGEESTFMQDQMGMKDDQLPEEFQFFDAEAEAQDTQQLHAAVETEANLFFEYLKNRLAVENERRMEQDEEDEVNFITFDGLIKPGQERREVAAQAFSHTLLLATRGLLTVSQEEQPFGEIQIGIF